MEKKVRDRIDLKKGTLLLVCVLGRCTGVCRPSEGFLGIEDILEGWRATYGNIRNMKVLYCEELVDYQTSSGEKSPGDLVKYQHVERLEQDEKYHIRYSVAEDGFANPKELMEHAFDGTINIEYLGRDGLGTIQRGLIGRDVESKNHFRTYMLLSVSRLSAEKRTAADVRTTFEKILMHPLAAVKESLESVIGQPCHVVEVVQNDGTSYKVWVAHNKGMLPMRYQGFRNGEIASEITVEELGNTADGESQIWYPAKACRRLYNYNGGTLTYELNVEEFARNVEIDDKSFTFDFPEGTKVIDQIAGLFYTKGTGTGLELGDDLEGVPLVKYLGDENVPKQGSNNGERIRASRGNADGSSKSQASPNVKPPEGVNGESAKERSLGTTSAILCGLVAGVCVLVVALRRRRR
ncbi:MAG: hypothetical protein ACYTBJ_24460 [Planctomycetota bacterium]|jgi:hypothetical protein